MGTGFRHASAAMVLLALLRCRRSERDADVRGHSSWSKELPESDADALGHSSPSVGLQLSPAVVSPMRLQAVCGARGLGSSLPLAVCVVQALLGPGASVRRLSSSPVAPCSQLSRRSSTPGRCFAGLWSGRSAIFVHGRIVICGRVRRRPPPVPGGWALCKLRHLPLSFDLYVGCSGLVLLQVHGSSTPRSASLRCLFISWKKNTCACLTAHGESGCSGCIEPR